MLAANQETLEEGITTFRQGDFEKALKLFRSILKNDDKNSVVLNNIGICYLKLEKPKQAKEYFEKALAANSKMLEAYYNLANILFNSENYLEAIENYRKVLKLAPRHPDIYLHLGISLAKSDEYKEAEKYLKYYLSVNQKDAEAWSNYGVVLSRQGKFDEAIEAYKRSLQINPNFWDAQYNVGILYSRKKEYKKTVDEFEKLVLKNPDHSRALSHLVNRSPYILDWKRAKKYAPQLDKLTGEEIRSDLVPGEQAFMSVIRKDEPDLNLKIAKAWSKGYMKQNQDTRKKMNLKTNKDKKKKKLKIGYVSDGFRDFPTGHNLVRVLELHNKKKFKVYAYSHGIDDGSPWRERSQKAVDEFVDIRVLNDAQVAKKINDDGIDILIDLKGHTKDSRLNIFSFRPAPVAITWLGFPGSTGADFIDFIIADKIVLPPAHKKYYTEKVLYMPHTYRPADDAAPISVVPFEREDFGLPNEAFVLASFHSPYKLDPKMLDIWADILKKVPEAVLWQLMDDYDVSQRLKKEYRKREIDSKRIIMAEKIVKEAHLRRMQLADLALDTRIVNGHTTTVDSLWAGLPVVALLGKHFCSRVSASVLTAIGLPEMIAKDLRGYKKIAVDLAGDPEALRKIKQELEDNKETRPLFDIEQFTKDLENLYWDAWKRQ